MYLILIVSICILLKIFEYFELANDNCFPAIFRVYFISFSCDIVDTELCVVVYTLALLSGAPKLVCRRNNDPNTRRLFDSSELRDVNEPVLWEIMCDISYIYLILFVFFFIWLV